MQHHAIQHPPMDQSQPHFPQTQQPYQDQCSGAYRQLHSQHSGVLQALSDSSHQNNSLQNELRQTYENLTGHKAKIAEYEILLGSQCSSSQKGNCEDAKAAQSENTIRDLQVENANLVYSLRIAQGATIANGSETFNRVDCIDPCDRAECLQTPTSVQTPATTSFGEEGER
ncbi:hypothetical protein VTL71DRAFT_5004 [Oculimacula yallundae]|uniref:Uncharacterized protein n=1 Tax=Oculimacula yallundae TaxID=86028 RepID=A0ABR4C019_9HELO